LTQGALWGNESGAQGAAIERFGGFQTPCRWEDPAMRIDYMCITQTTPVRCYIA